MTLLARLFAAPSPLRTRRGIDLDFPLLAGCLALLGLGLVMMTSASSEVAAALSGNPLYHMIRHLIYLAIGISAAVATLLIPMAFWQRYGASLLLIAFALLVRAPTIEGRKLLDEIAGLKLYLGVAERDELARMPGPDAPPLLDAERYQALLPYAVALEVEEAWTRKFTLAVGAAAAATATAGMAWYHGVGSDNLSSLTSAIGSSLSSQIASASTPPGSSSGSGGGGSSGGGGGGGGGGGR